MTWTRRQERFWLFLVWYPALLGAATGEVLVLRRLWPSIGWSISVLIGVLSCLYLAVPLAMPYCYVMDGELGPERPKRTCLAVVGLQSGLAAAVLGTLLLTFPGIDWVLASFIGIYGGGGIGGITVAVYVACKKLGSMTEQKRKQEKLRMILWGAVVFIAAALFLVSFFVFGWWWWCALFFSVIVGTLLSAIPICIYEQRDTSRVRASWTDSYDL